MSATSPDGGIGRRARFRSVCREAWRFESSSGHQDSVYRCLPTSRKARFSGLFSFARPSKGGQGHLLVSSAFLGVFLSICQDFRPDGGKIPLTAASNFELSREARSSDGCIHVPQRAEDAHSRRPRPCRAREGRPDHRKNRRRKHGQRLCRQRLARAGRDVKAEATLVKKRAGCSTRRVPASEIGRPSVAAIAPRARGSRASRATSARRACEDGAGAAADGFIYHRTVYRGSTVSGGEHAACPFGLFRGRKESFANRAGLPRVNAQLS